MKPVDIGRRGHTVIKLGYGARCGCELCQDSLNVSVTVKYLFDYVPVIV